jgi:hypothetical protein
MTLCPDCQRAEDDRLHAVYRNELCCYARSIMSGLLRDRGGNAAAVKRAITPAEWAVVRARLVVLIERERADAAAADEKGPSVSRQGAEWDSGVRAGSEAPKPGTDERAEVAG